MEQTPRHVRIFLSSPGDVNQEREIAWRVIDALPDRPVFRDKITIRLIAWDKPGGETPMLAKLTPQEAINLGHPTPSECDIVVVIFWSRMGTPFKINNKEYLSGTQWEYLDAMESSNTEVIVYRRTEKVEIDLDAPDFEERQRQYERVKTFFESFYDAETGQALRGANQYETPEDFRQKFETHLEELVQRLLDRDAQPRNEPEEAPTVTSKVWQGSPFPGLRAYTDVDAPIFFGRGHEIDELVKRLDTAPFVAVTGASGSGKSSLVGAGLIPRLKANAVVGSKDWLLPLWNSEINQWLGLRFTPGEVGDNPFMPLALKLRAYLKNQSFSAHELATRLAAQPGKIDEYISQALSDKPDWAVALIFVDQFEELFTLASDDLCRRFIDMLGHLVVNNPRVRIVATMRVDFYAAAVQSQTLAVLFQNHYPLATPGFHPLYEMITRPAERAALPFDEGLPDQILEDTGTAPGSLALMAYLLDELYNLRGEEQQLTFEKYHSLGGVQGAIAQRAENTFTDLSLEVQARLTTVFRSLVQVSDDGIVTRQRMSLNALTISPSTKVLVEALIKARLLVSGVDHNNQPVVEIAHEALLTHWPRLRRELESDREFLQWRQQLRRDMQEWNQHQQDRSYLYSGARLIIADQWSEKHMNDLYADEREFLGASRDLGKRRRVIRWSLVSTFAILFMVIAPFVFFSLYTEWLRQQVIASSPMWSFETAAAELGVDNQPIEVPAFSLDLYEISHGQYGQCVQARVCSRIRAPSYAEEESNLYPVTWVNAYQAAEFCDWLNRRLPTAVELERVSRGTTGRPFPWGDAAPSPTLVNLPIDQYPDQTPSGTVPVNDSAFIDGATPEGILHLLGNVWEWTATPAGCGGVSCAEVWDGQDNLALEIRGQGWATTRLTSDTWSTVVTESQVAEPIITDLDIGFRCAQ